MRFNDNIVGQIIRADSLGASPQEMKELYIQRNAFEVDVHAPIYRIVRLEHLYEDLRDKCLTHTKIDKLGWGDSTENPLLDRSFVDEVTGNELTLNGVVGSVFGSCWSRSKLDQPDEWAIFSRLQPSVRLQSTPHKLLAAAMSIENPFYSLQHMIGKMRYQPEQEIEAHFGDPDWQKHLDSLGQGIAASFLILSEDLSNEDEVRLLYNHLDEPWARVNARLTGQFAKIPFDWGKAIQEVTVGPFVVNESMATLSAKLRELGITCPISIGAAKS